MNNKTIVAYTHWDNKIIYWDFEQGCMHSEKELFDKNWLNIDRGFWVNIGNQEQVVGINMKYCVGIEHIRKNEYEILFEKDGVSFNLITHDSTQAENLKNAIINHAFLNCI